MKKRITRFAAKVLLKRQHQRDKWISVGTAFQVSGGQINLLLDSLPIRESCWDGTIVLFLADDEKDILAEPTP